MSSQVNDTLTNLAEQLKSFGHNTMNRCLKGEKLSPPLLWEQARSLVKMDPETYLIFEDMPRTPGASSSMPDTVR